MPEISNLGIDEKKWDQWGQNIAVYYLCRIRQVDKRRNREEWRGMEVHAWENGEKGKSKVTVACKKQQVSALSETCAPDDHYILT